MAQSLGSCPSLSSLGMPMAVMLKREEERREQDLDFTIAFLYDEEFRYGKLVSTTFRPALIPLSSYYYL